MTDPRMVMTDNELTGTISDMIGSQRRRRLLILFLILVGILAIVFDGKAESYQPDPTSPTMIPMPPTPPVYHATAAPADSVDPYAKYADDLVRHPGRPPDDLVTIKVSRYDPALGGVNCFRWGNGTCLSPMANGERWETNYEIAIACPAEWPMGTKVEIGWRLWICKDRGGKITQVRPGVFWVDQLSTVTYYAYGTEMPAGVWYP